MLPHRDDAPSGEPVAILGYPKDGPFTAVAGRLGPTRTVISEDAYGRGPMSRRMTSLRGRIRSGNSGGPGGRRGRPGGGDGLRGDHERPAGRLRGPGVDRHRRGATRAAAGGYRARAFCRRQSAGGRIIVERPDAGRPACGWRGACGRSTASDSGRSEATITISPAIGVAEAHRAVVAAVADQPRARSSARSRSATFSVRRPGRGSPPRRATTIAAPAERSVAIAPGSPS